MGPRGTGADTYTGDGFSREETETWARLRVYRSDGIEPNSTLARVHLGWLFFSSNPDSAAEWKQALPDDCKRARNLVSKWHRRFLKHTIKLQNAGEF